MVELWLNFKDENGEDKRVLVEGDKFSIGRTSDNELQIPLNNLSRQHAKIERFADVFIVSDCGSSNGTFLNDEKLTDPVSLQKGDNLNLADAIGIEIEIISDKDKAKNNKASNGGSDQNDKEDSKPSTESAKTAVASSSGSTSTSNSSMSMGFFLIAPILGVFVLLIIGAVFLLIPGKEPVVVQNNNYYSNETNDDIEDEKTNSNDKTPEKTETPTPTQTPISENNISNNPTTTNTPISSPVEEITPSPVSNDIQKIENATASFMRRMAKNDPKAFLTGSQISIVKPKIDQFKNSSVLADNIKNAQKNAEAIKSLAVSRDFRPQFLANAAITKLGNQRGDVVAVAKEMVESLSKIAKPFGNESADECLLIMAAYSGNKTGEGLQETAGVLVNKFRGKVSVRRVRSIWFFKENDKLDNSQFEYALRFLAIGTITQNPKDFNVQAEALQL